MRDRNRRDSISRRQMLGSTTAAMLAGLAGCSGGGGGNTDNGGQTNNESGDTSTDTASEDTATGTESGDTSTDTESGETSTETESGTQSNQNIDLSTWTWAIHTNAAEALAEQYDKANVQVADQPSGKVGDKLVQSLQSQSNLPSISLIRSFLLKNVARNGGMRQITDVVKENEDRLFTISKSKNIVDGEYFSMPNDLGPFVLMYNKDAITKTGLPAEPSALEEELQTWDDYLKAGQEWQDQTGDPFLSMPATQAGNGIPVALQIQAGGRWYTPDGKFEFDQQPNVKAFELTKQLYEISGHYDWFTSQYWENFRSGAVPTNPAPAWATGIMKPNLEEMEGKWRVAKLPALEQGGPRGSNFGGASAGVPLAISQEKQNAAIEWGKFWHFSDAAFNEKIKAGVFPATKPAGAEQLEREDSFFGGQQVVKKFVAAAEASPPEYSRPSERAQSISRDAIRKIVAEGQPIQETLSQASEEILSGLDEKDKSIETIT